MKCVECRKGKLEPSTAEETLQVGDYVVRMDVPVQECSSCHEVYLPGEIAEQMELSAANLLAEAGVCSGAVFKFMRKSLGMRAVDLAELLSVTPETVSRWENDHVPVDRCAYSTVASLIADRLEGCTRTADRLRALLDAPGENGPREFRGALGAGHAPASSP
jgi:YgiT-type zinc finger domain-containing protein